MQVAEPEVAVQQYRRQVGYEFAKPTANGFDRVGIASIDQAAVTGTPHLRQQPAFCEEPPAIAVWMIVLRRVAAEPAVREAEPLAPGSVLQREAGAGTDPVIDGGRASAQVFEDDAIRAHLENVRYA
jgi:hypothetical protein